VRIVGTHLDREIIETSKATNRHPKFVRDFPLGISFYQIEELNKALEGCDFIIGGVSSFGVEWFGDVVLPIIPESAIVLTVTKGLMDTPDGKLLTYVDIITKFLKDHGYNIVAGNHETICEKNGIRISDLYYTNIGLDENNNIKFIDINVDTN
jgi:glycerol-3-phosphate dehydrogenase (NAD(P)+)